ncbi:MAG: hypothetical protein PVI06_03725 [Desulfobacterales bacterium]
MGSIVGEMRVYGRCRTTASMIVTKESMIYYLSRDKLRQMEKNDSELAADLDKQMARLLGVRLANATRTIQALMEYQCSFLAKKGKIFFW